MKCTYCLKRFPAGELADDIDFSDLANDGLICRQCYARRNRGESVAGPHPEQFQLNEGLLRQFSVAADTVAERLATLRASCLIDEVEDDVDNALTHMRRAMDESDRGSLRVEMSRHLCSVAELYVAAIETLHERCGAPYNDFAGEFDRIASYLCEVVALDLLDVAYAYYTLGIVRERLGRYSDAIEAYQRASESNAPGQWSDRARVAITRLESSGSLAAQAKSGLCYNATQQGVQLDAQASSTPVARPGRTGRTIVTAVVLLVLIGVISQALPRILASIRPHTQLVLTLKPYADKGSMIIDEQVAEEVEAVLRRRLGSRSIPSWYEREAPTRLLLQVPTGSDLHAIDEMTRTRGRLEFKEQRYNPGTRKVEWVSAMDGASVASAGFRVDSRSGGGPDTVVVTFQLTQDGARKFGELTTRLVGKPLAIFFDNRLISAHVSEPITQGAGMISPISSQRPGEPDVEEARRIADLLNSGELPCRIDIERARN